MQVRLSLQPSDCPALVGLYHPFWTPWPSRCTFHLFLGGLAQDSPSPNAYIERIFLYASLLAFLVKVLGNADLKS